LCVRRTQPRIQAFSLLLNDNAIVLPVLVVNL
jgi:hypothetical protein